MLMVIILYRKRSSIIRHYKNYNILLIFRIYTNASPWPFSWLDGNDVFRFRLSQSSISIISRISRTKLSGDPRLTVVLSSFTRISLSSSYFQKRHQLFFLISSSPGFRANWLMLWVSCAIRHLIISRSATNV